MTTDRQVHELVRRYDQATEALERDELEQVADILATLEGTVLPEDATPVLRAAATAANRRLAEALSAALTRTGSDLAQARRGRRLTERLARSEPETGRAPRS